MDFYSFYVFQLVQGNRKNFNRIKETEEAVPYFQETEPNPISGSVVWFVFQFILHHQCIKEY